MNAVKRTLRIVVSFVLLMATVLGGGSAATAHGWSPHPSHWQPVYLALGDSIANGQQSAPLADDYWSTVARWQRKGYVAQFADYLAKDLRCKHEHNRGTTSGCRDLELLNISRSAVPEMDGQPAKPGVTTAILIEEQLPVATTLLQSRNHDRDRSNNVSIVTLTVGGNDIFGPITQACLAADPSGCPAAIQASFGAFAVNYSQILAQLRAAAGQRTRILTMTYYNPLPFCALGQANPIAGPFGDWVLEGGTLNDIPLTVGFNDIIRSISAQYGAKVADTFGDLGAGDFVGGTDCLHPDKSGHTKIAAAFEEALAG